MSEARKELAKQFINSQMLLYRYQMQSFKNFGPYGNPHRGQGRVLSVLKTRPEISQKELTDLMNMSKQSLAELIGKLEKSGYIKREPSERNSRVFNISLTAGGAAVADKLEDTPPEIAQLFDCLSDEEVNTFSEYLKRITEEMAKQFLGSGTDLHEQMLKEFMKNHGQKTDSAGESIDEGDSSASFGNNVRYPNGSGYRPDDESDEQ